MYSYLNIGNAIMLSEGRPGVDNTFMLAEGCDDLSRVSNSEDKADL